MTGCDWRGVVRRGSWRGGGVNRGRVNMKNLGKQVYVILNTYISFPNVLFVLLRLTQTSNETNPYSATSSEFRCNGSRF